MPQLKKILGDTKYDTFNSDPNNGAPNPDPNFTQKYTPKPGNSYEDAYKNIQNGDPITSNLKNTLGDTKYDAFNSDPNNGAPIPDPRFSQRYTPRTGETYEDNLPT